MKSRFLNAELFACALFATLSSCSSDDAFINDNKGTVESLNINVIDGTFTSVDKNNVKTRATDDGTGTSFTKDDAIGVFVVKSDGSLALTNDKYIYDGSKWLNGKNAEKLPYYDGAKYFAYYPYKDDLYMTGKYDANNKTTTATDFFASLISDWTPDTNQGTQVLYTAQDLMVSMASVSDYSCTFVMAHQMSIVEMDLHQAHYTYGGIDKYRFTFNSHTPYKIANGKYRILVNPSKSISIKGSNQYNSTDVSKTKSWNISGKAPAAATYKIYKYNGANAWLTETARQNVYIGDVNIGEYLYTDGTTGSTVPDVSSDKKIAGIIFSDQISAEEYTANFTHGYVLALNNASTDVLEWKSESTEANLDKVTTVAGCYNDITSGYKGTITKSYNKDNSSYPAWKAANSYNVTVSGTNSGWYLPSAGQLWDVAANLGKYDLSGKQTLGDTFIYAYALASGSDTNIKTVLTTAGGTVIDGYLWSASEYDVNDGVMVFFGGSSSGIGVTHHAKSYTDTSNRVRAVLAY